MQLGWAFFSAPRRSQWCRGLFVLMALAATPAMATLLRIDPTQSSVTRFGAWYTTECHIDASGAEVCEMVPMPPEYFPITGLLDVWTEHERIDDGSAVYEHDLLFVNLRAFKTDASALGFDLSSFVTVFSGADFYWSDPMCFRPSAYTSACSTWSTINASGSGHWDGETLTFSGFQGMVPQGFMLSVTARVLAVPEPMTPLLLAAALLAGCLQRRRAMPGCS